MRYIPQSLPAPTINAVSPTSLVTFLYQISFYEVIGFCFLWLKSIVLGWSFAHEGNSQRELTTYEAGNLQQTEAVHKITTFLNFLHGK